MTRLLLIALTTLAVANTAPLETIAEEKSSELREVSREVRTVGVDVEELTYPEELPKEVPKEYPKLPEWSLFEGDSTAEALSEEDRKTLEALILNPVVTQEHFLNVTEPDPEPTLGQKLKALFVKFQDKVKNLGTSAKEVVELVKENIRSIRDKQKDPNASEDEVKKTAWDKIVYTVKRWFALNDEGKAQMRKNFPNLAKFLDTVLEKFQKQICGFACVVDETKKENKEKKEAEKQMKETDKGTEAPATKEDVLQA